ncbi:uncharacterized protein LOC120330100 isoform X2 [Styela clava]
MNSYFKPQNITELYYQNMKHKGNTTEKHLGNWEECTHETSRTYTLPTKCIKSKSNCKKIFQISSSCRNIFILFTISFIMFGNIKEISATLQNNFEKEIRNDKSEYGQKELWMIAMKSYFDGSLQEFGMKDKMYDFLLEMKKSIDKKEKVTTDIPSEETTKSWLQFMEEDAMNSYDEDTNQTELHRFRRETGEGSGSGYEPTTTTEASIEQTTAQEEGSGITTEAHSETTTDYQNNETNTTPFLETSSEQTTFVPSTSFEMTPQSQTAASTEQTTSQEVSSTTFEMTPQSQTVASTEQTTSQKVSSTTFEITPQTQTVASTDRPTSQEVSISVETTTFSDYTTGELTTQSDHTNLVTTIFKTEITTGTDATYSDNTTLLTTPMNVEETTNRITSTSSFEISTASFLDLCTTDPDSCSSDQFCVQTSTIKKCECRPGLTADSNDICDEPVKQFGGQLHVDVEYNEDLDDPSSAYYQEQEKIYINVLKLAYKDETWYIDVKIIGFKRGSTVAQYELTTKDDESVNSSTIEESFAVFLTNDTYFPDNCTCDSVNCSTQGLDLTGPLISDESCNDAGGATTVLCSQPTTSQFCENSTSSCDATTEGVIYCNCKAGFVSNPDTPNSCIKQICQFNTNSGCNAPFGQCTNTANGVGQCKCMWGFYGTNCYEPWLFVFVVVISGLVFIAIIVVVVCCIKKRRAKKSWKNSMNYYDNVIYENDGKISRDGRYKNTYEWDQQMSSVVPKSPYDNTLRATEVHEISDSNGHDTPVSRNVHAETHKLDDWITTDENSEQNPRQYEYAQVNRSYQTTEDNEIDQSPREMSTFSQTKF